MFSRGVMHPLGYKPASRKGSGNLIRLSKSPAKRLYPLLLVLLLFCAFSLPKSVNKSPSLTGVVKTSLIFIIIQDPCALATVRNPMNHQIHYILLQQQVSDCKDLPRTLPSVSEVNCELQVNCREQIKTELDRLGSAASSVILCVDCKEWMTASLSSLNIPLISMSNRDFNEAVWFTSLTIDELLSWHDLKYEIVVVTTCRMGTLIPLLEDLKYSFYFGDALQLSIFLESSPSTECLDFVDSFEWKHGPKIIHQRIRPSGGPEVAIPEAVRPPATKTNFGILLEDDIGISTQFYSWLKFVGLQMVNSEAYSESDMFSISLYTPRVLETGIQRRELIDYEKNVVQRGGVFAFEVPCSWGSAFQGAFWRTALNYFEQRYTDQNIDKDVIKNSRVKGWKGSWKKWLIELSYMRHAVTIYPLFNNETSFSTNMLMKGTHITEASEEVRQQYMVPLFESSKWFFLLQSPRLFQKRLDRFDAFFQRTHAKS